MQPAQIAGLLKSYIVGLQLPTGIYDQLSTYLDLLLRWNAKTNLTAIRDPEQIVTRHFGESLFAAGVLFGAERPRSSTTLADIGSGAGFPGIPIKLALPELQVTLIESQNKKATFLREVIRALRLEGIDVYACRAEHWDKQVDIVTLRAVERFESAVAIALRLLAPNGRLCLIAGAAGLGQLCSQVQLRCTSETRIPGTRESFLVVAVATVSSVNPNA